jgi:hypothetical protein
MIFSGLQQRYMPQYGTVFKVFTDVIIHDFRVSKNSPLAFYALQEPLNAHISVGLNASSSIRTFDTTY